MVDLAISWVTTAVATTGLAFASVLFAPLAHAQPTAAPADAETAPETTSAPEEPGREQPAEVDLGAPPEPDTPTSAPVEDDPDARARDHYFRGEEAYNLGDFDRAIENFEAAYSLSNRPDLLYNVSLSYFRRYDASRELPDLKRARAVLVNFELALQRDPSLGDIDQVHELMKRIDKRLADRARTKDAGPSAPDEGTSDSAPEGPMTADACPIEHEAEDPGRGQRIGGAVSMATGSLILAGGIASIAAFTLKGQEFENTLSGLQQDFTSEGCEDASSSRCEFLQQSIDTTVNNGRQANILAATLGSGLTALGAAAVITGAIFYVQGNKRTNRWEQSRLQVSPTARGVVLSGRF